MPAATQRGPPGKRRRLGEILLEAGVLDEPQLQAALIEQRRWGGRLGRTLVEMGFIDEDTMVRALSRQLGLTVVDLDAAQVNPKVVQLLRVDHAERYLVFPLAGDRTSKQLLLATSDPTNQDSLSELEFASGMNIVVQVATASAIERAIRQYYYGEAPTRTAAPDNFGATESTFDPEALVADVSPETASRASPAAAAPAPPAPAPVSFPAAVPAAQHELVKLQERVAALEMTMAQQVHALRSLLELLSGAGVISRDEYVDRLQKEP